MKCKWLTLLASLGAVVLLSSSIGVTRSSFVDLETSSGNTFQAWASTQWKQTSRTDFEAGVLNNVDTSSSPGDVKLSTNTTTFGSSFSQYQGPIWYNTVYVQETNPTSTYPANYIVPYNGEVISWSYNNWSENRYTSNVRLEFLTGSRTTWTMRVKSAPVTIGPGTNTFNNVSIPVSAGWHMGLYTGSSPNNLAYSVDWGGTVQRRAQNSGDFNVDATRTDFGSRQARFPITVTLRYFSSSGTIASQVLDTGIAGDRWDALFWDRTLQSGTNITFEVRASNTSFAKDTPPGTLPWISVGGTSPVTSGLPSGRYMQWRATLTTSDTSKTPTLQEVRVYHY